MRNLLAEHRDERVLYWRLTGEHTPHVIAIYEQFGMPAIKGAIDSYEYGTEVVGGMLSLRDLRVELLALSDELGELADEYRALGSLLRQHILSTGDVQPAFGGSCQLARGVLRWDRAWWVGVWVGTDHHQSVIAW